MKSFFTLLTLSLILCISCSKQISETVVQTPVVEKNMIDKPAEQTEIIWDEWGVPHIYATDNDKLFYSFGWAQMKSHANTILLSLIHI